MPNWVFKFDIHEVSQVSLSRTATSSACDNKGTGKGAEEKRSDRHSHNQCILAELRDSIPRDQYEYISHMHYPKPNYQLLPGLLGCF